MTRRLVLPLVLALALGACRDAIAPFDAVNPGGPQFDVLADSASPVHILRQAPGAPPLETYRVSFWARQNKESIVAVNYRPAAGQSVRDPFLRFRIPKFGLKWAPDGRQLLGDDSLLITLTIDTVNLSVNFQPSGVAFSSAYPPDLVISYAHADPDLNADGAVDATDLALEQQLAIWWRDSKASNWLKALSRDDTTNKYVAASLYHFSQYAVSW